MSSKTNLARKYVVLGGCGAIGRIVVRDLLESHPRNQVVLADFNLDAARAYARALKSARVTPVFCDVRKPLRLVKVLAEGRVVINCTQHDFNLKVMRAALKARVHYIDLGGLFHWTRKQLKLHADFKRAGLTAILGGGCAPGITNVLTRMAVERLGRVDAVAIRVGCVDLAPRRKGFSFPYSPQTIVEELTLTPWVYSGGRFHEIRPCSRWECVPFPKPLGKTWTVCTRHSEVATLPLSFKLKACDFKVSFDREFVAEVLRRLKAGQTVVDFRKLPMSRKNPRDMEVSRVVAWSGERSVIIDCEARANRKWIASAGDVDTGCPPSIIAQLIVTGVIKQRGVLPPEIAVPVKPFVVALAKRGMKVKIR